MSARAIECDAMLLNWTGETCKNGPRLLIELFDEDQLEPFKLATVKKGKVAGQMYKVVFVEVDGNGQPIEPEPEPPKKRGGGKFPGGYCGLAVRWCGEKDFAAWLEREFQGLADDAPISRATNHVEFNKWMVMAICGVMSRKELDSDDDAGQVFNDQIRSPYAASRKERGLDD